MNTTSLVRTIAIFLSAALLAPAAFFVAPQEAQAQWPTIVWNDFSLPALHTAGSTAFAAIKDTLIEIHTATSAVAEWAGYINTYVLQPLAFVTSGKMTKMLTASVIGFVIGKANGTGIPQFVVDVRKSMQTVSDGAALAYLKQINMTNSPFSSSIQSALSSDYLSKTSLKGFWDANLCSLSRSSPNVRSYLSGNWSQGGVAAWFALTTQSQNNPYTLYSNVQGQLAATIGPVSAGGGVTAVRAAQLNQNAGFLSWCGGGSDTTSTTDSADAGSAIAITEDVCLSGKYPGYEWDTVSKMCVLPSSSSAGVNPGDPCLNKDGTSGTIQTPGSTIKATLDKVLGSQQDQIGRMGNIGPEIQGILSDIGSIVNTVNFASSILGGNDSGAGGLLSAGNTSSSNSTSRLAQFSGGLSDNSYLGVTTTHIVQSASSQPTGDTRTPDPTGSGSSTVTPNTAMGAKVKMYLDGWFTIYTAATMASTSVTSLMSFCSTTANAAAQALITDGTYPFGTDLSTIHTTFIDAARAQIPAALTALRTEIDPVFVRASATTSIATAALAMDAKVTSESSSGSTSYVADSLTLQNMQPTSTDVATAQQNAMTFNAAVANPTGSLNVSGSTSSGAPASTVDQMMLISSNATALKQSVCTPPPPTASGG